MITLKLYDRNGIELNFGDFVKISDGKYFTFYAEVTYLEKEKNIAPFCTFSFHSFEKVDSIPENAKKGNEDRYNFWYLSSEPDEDLAAEKFNQYLVNWRNCEDYINRGTYKLFLNDPS